MPTCQWSNVKVMANQGRAPKIKELYDRIVNDPFSECFFLSRLWDQKEQELKAKHPHFWEDRTHNVARMRTELVLTEMALHIQLVKVKGLRSRIHG